MIPKREINDLSELLNLLENSSKDEYKELGKRIVISIDDLAPYIHFDDHSYTRNCIRKSDDYELILLCWEQGQHTPIHSHNEQECWVHVVEGEFSEIRYREEEGILSIDHEMKLKKEKVSYMNDDMGFHALANTANGRAMSLHLYMDPIDECEVYDEDQDSFATKSLSYHSFEGELVQV